MDEILQEIVNSRGVQMRVDQAAGVIRGVKLLGLHSRNGRRYLPAALTAAAGLYEGAKVNVNHPKGSPLAARDYQDRLGAIRNVSVRENDGLFGDLHFNPKHALAEQLLWDATHAPENVGLSHNVSARTSRQGSETVVEAILKVQSVDLVADPATTRGLYEGAEPHAAATLPEEHLSEMLEQVTLDQLRSARADLVEALQAEAAAECIALRGEVERLRDSEKRHERRALAAKLLKEYQLPELDTADAAARPMVSQLFVESLLTAADERAMRVLVRERAELIAAARQLDRGRSESPRPLSREQNRIEPANRVTDARSFVRAIT